MAVDNPSNLMPDQEIIIEGDAGFVPKASPSDAGKVLGVLNSSGDVGWVVDQSGTFIQVQADWAETDSSQPSYIDHKPDLSVYATASGVETALAGKQDTISDLSEIRAGAAKGDTAVQPSTLESYATTSAMNTALAGKQDVINDLSDIRSGASAGATAVQPSALDSYATTSAMNTALAGKQDTISDLATIRSGASAGATAVQPATLESYATTSAMNTALASKQDTISDLSTIRAGAAAGATAAQPADLPSSDELVPSASSGDAGKVLTVANDGTAGWVTPSAGTVYTAGDGVDITSDVISADVDGTTIGIDSTTKKIKSLQVIPTKTSDLQNDSNFVVASSLANVATSGSYADLSNKPSIPAAQVQSDYAQSNSAAVDYIKNKPDLSVYAQSANLATVATSGNYSDLSGKPTIPSVDQTYNASSTNAQSGTAVAQAIASIPSSSYTAGDGIDITSGEISVDYDSNTLDTVGGTTTESVSYVDEYDGFTLPSAIQQMQTQSDTVNVTVHIPANTFKYVGNKDDMTFTFALCRGLGARWVNSYVNAPLSYTEESNNVYWIDEQNIVITLPTLQTNGWEYDTNLSTKESFNVVATDDNSHSHIYLTTISNDGTLASPVTFTYSGGSHEMLTVKNPLPASAQADSGKVLKVNASGNAEWGTDSFTTTAGITDIQQVAALPANPVATVLYLIPET